MPVTQLPLNEIILAAVLAFCRIGACLMLMPGISSARIPLQVRLFIALACSFAVLPLVLQRIVTAVDAGQPWTLFRLMAGEMFIGALIGILAHIYFWALQFMANMMAMAVGYSGSPADSITENEPQATLATIVTFSALFLFFVTDMHLEIFRALLNSYVAIPVDGRFRPDAAMIDFTDALSAAFLATLRIAAPFIVFAILVNFAIGLVNKLTPAIPVYFISMPFVLGEGCWWSISSCRSFCAFSHMKPQPSCANFSEGDMAQAGTRNLRKLVELQKLGCARHEAALAIANARKSALDEERAALIAMQDRRYDANALDIDPSLVIRRLEINAVEMQQVESRLELARKALLKEQRRVELLQDRLNDAQADRERRELASLIEEFVSRKTSDESQKRS